MDTPTRVRLEKLLGMLGSEFDGERAAAARKIHNMAVKRKVTIVQLVMGNPQGVTHYPAFEYPAPRKPRKPRPEPTYNYTAPSHSLLSALAGHKSLFNSALTVWEFQFATDMLTKYMYDNELSKKQQDAVHSILAVLDRAAAKPNP